MKAHIIKDCCNKHHIVLEKKFYKDICEQADMGPYWSINLDDIYEIIMRPNFSEKYRYPICYAILNCYLYYLKDHTISVEEITRLMKFWWTYRDYAKLSNDEDVDKAIIIQLMGKIVTKNIVNSKILPEITMKSLIMTYCQNKAHEWREITDFDSLIAWIRRLRPDYDALLHEAELQVYIKETRS